MTGEIYDGDKNIDNTNFNNNKNNIYLNLSQYRTIFKTHRSGWKYAIDSLMPIHHPKGILMIDFIERYFSWENKKYEFDYKHIRIDNYTENVPLEKIRIVTVNSEDTHGAWLKNNKIIYWCQYNLEWMYLENFNLDYTKYPLVYKTAEIITQDWIGVIHNPSNYNNSIIFENDKEHSPQSIFKKIEFRESLKSCVGIIVLSKWMERWLEGVFSILELDIPLTTLYHPTEIIPLELCFNYEKIKKTVIQIGYWLRDVKAIWELKLNSDWKKIWLYGSPHGLKIFSDNFLSEEEKKIFGQKSNSLSFEWSYLNSIVEIKNVDNIEYDRLLSESIGFVYIIDSSCNNAIIECVARKTPLLINKHPAVIEYLGVDYPFYYDTMEEAVIKINDLNLINNTVKYMESERCFCKKYLSGESFLNSFLNSKVGKNIQNIINNKRIDVVILWVDNNIKFTHINDSYIADSYTPNRFRSSFDELKYCLRSIQDSINFFNNIYIVVSDDQVLPSWLNTNFLTIVRHSEIFDNKDQLPNFNSCAIESYIYKIKGLSENFIYFNDDIFLMGKWNIDDMYEENKPFVFIENYEINIDNPIYSFEVLWKNSYKLLENKNINKQNIYPNLKYPVLAHCPYILNKELFLNAEKLISKELSITRNSKFRGFDNIITASGLFQYLASDKVIFKPLKDSINFIYISSDNIILNNIIKIDKKSVISIQDDTFGIINNETILKLKEILDSLWVKSIYEY
jgi:hypothetical protein